MTLSTAGGAGSLAHGPLGPFEQCVTFTPPRYAERSDWPLLLYLHGSSARGDFARLANGHGGLVKYLLPGQPLAALPMVVVAPLCPKGTEWEKPATCARLHALVDAAVAQLGVAPSGHVVTGNSMGGLGSCMVVCRDARPQRGAAAIPSCGGGKPVLARTASPAGARFWFFHAASDKTVVVEDTDALVEALKTEGAAEVRYTRYETAPHPDEEQCEGHNAWDGAWQTTELWDWVESVAEESRAAAIRAVFQGPEPEPE